MTREELIRKYESFEEIIDSSTTMNEANSSFTIYEGEFVIKNIDKTENKKSELVCNGKIVFNWFPKIGLRFYGKSYAIDIKKVIEIDDLEKIELLSNDGINGIGYINNTTYERDNTLTIEGQLIDKAIKGDKTIPVNTVTFSLPNFKGFTGQPVKKITDKKVVLSNSRIILEDEKYLIKIDRRLSSKVLENSLKENGGYLILYEGEIKAKKSSILYEDCENIRHCLNIFLTFLNGRRTSILFLNGKFNNEILWSDYTANYHIDIYEYSPSWTNDMSVKNFNELWKNFRQLWSNNSNKDFLSSSIHWWVEANKGSGFIEGSLIMTQTALELIYNWFIVENKKMIFGKDSENINASNKIRLLLSQLNISLETPNEFDDLQDYKKTNKIIDAPEAIVQIRNAIVHSQEEKRKKLTHITTKAKYEALQLSLWYIELSLLKILNYNGEYSNRCKNIFNKSELVPWMESDINKINY